MGLSTYGFSIWSKRFLYLWYLNDFRIFGIQKVFVSLDSKMVSVFQKVFVSLRDPLYRNLTRHIHMLILLAQSVAQ